MSRNRNKVAPHRSLAGAVAFAALALVAGAVAWVMFHRPRPLQTASGPVSDRQVFKQYAGSQSCRECHTNAFAAWQRSHHGLAERKIEPQDHAAFDPARTIQHGTQSSEARRQGADLLLVTATADGKKSSFRAERVIGEAPLRQYLFAAPGGRYQISELAYDPAKKDWFDVFGDEDRKPGEWGHWTGRGMTWNQMCASCHNTRLRKHYDSATDSYATTMAEPSVGCEACHGPMADHVRWQRDHGKAFAGKTNSDPTIVKIDHAATMGTCGMCHARRGDITGEFAPGQAFSDHFNLTMVDETDIYYPDGQVRDEDYEYASFLSSKMFGAGVWCMDCHDPHAAKVKANDNSLCMRCHAPPLQPAPKIDEAKHSFHPAGKEGSKCVDCHMPQTTYMQRHARRDHGFTIPDPLLTKQFGVPNACNRCHKDKTTDWALETVEKWYGKRMERPTRDRAVTIAEARRGNTNAVPKLVRLAKDEKLGYWRAAATGLLGEYAGMPESKSALVDRVKDRNPVVRAKAAHSLMPFIRAGDDEAKTALESLLKDEARVVRVEAAWSLHSILDTNTLAGRELLASLEFNSDQPAGAMQRGTFLLDRGDAVAALPWFEKAVAWDRFSAPLRDSLAVCYSTLGRTADAVRELEAACQSAPRDAQLRYRLGLALNEAGRLNEAVSALEQTVKIEPQFSSAWYNLGLAYSQLDRSEDALNALVHAENLEHSSARAPYARATVLAKLGRTEEARRAAQRALEVQRDFREAQELLRALQ